MNLVVDKLVELVGGIAGIDEVLDNGYDAPNENSLVVGQVEIDLEKDAEPQELPIDKLNLGQRVQIGLHVYIGKDKGAASAARDQAQGLARKVRSALMQDTALDGACQTLQVGITRFHYAEWHGASYALALVELAVETEEAFS